MKLRHTATAHKVLCIGLKKRTLFSRVPNHLKDNLILLFKFSIVCIIANPATLGYKYVCNSIVMRSRASHPVKIKGPVKLQFPLICFGPQVVTWLQHDFDTNREITPANTGNLVGRSSKYKVLWPERRMLSREDLSAHPRRSKFALKLLTRRTLTSSIISGLDARRLNVHKCLFVGDPSGGVTSR